MKILPINNINAQNTQFKAKFSKQDVNLFIKELEGCDIGAVPELYTMLEFIKNLPKHNAKILQSNYRPWYQIQLDDISATQGRYYICASHALKDITVLHKNNALKYTNIKRMSYKTFKNNFFKNSKKTIQDIENIFKE